MKVERFTIFALMTFAALWMVAGFWAPNALSAACRVQTAVVAANVVAVPVALSIGVPVADAAPYRYSYRAFAPPPPEPIGEAEIEAIAARVAEKLRPANGNSSANAIPASPRPPPSRPPAATSLVAQSVRDVTAEPRRERISRSKTSTDSIAARAWRPFEPCSTSRCRKTARGSPPKRPAKCSKN